METLSEKLTNEFGNGFSAVSIYLVLTFKR